MTANDPITIQQFVTGTWDFMKIALSVGGAALFYKIDRNQSEIYKRISILEKQGAKLQGAHDTMMEQGGHHRRHDDGDELNV